MEIALAPLQQRKLFVATPAYGGVVSLGYLTSIVKLQAMLWEYNIPFILQTMGNESLITRARNKSVDLFLQTDATELLFIDSDIEFDPIDVIGLMHFNQGIIGGAYPSKRINWQSVQKAADNVELSDLPVMGAFYTTHPFEGQIDLSNPHKPLDVPELATGFMLIRRDVFETLAPKRPSYSPPPEDISKHPGKISDFFPVGVHEDIYESEDYAFCRLARESNFPVQLCPWIKLNHYGTYAFTGDFLKTASILGEIK